MMNYIVGINARPIMLKFLPIMLLTNTQKITHYAQYYAHNYCNYATVHYNSITFNNEISRVSSSLLCFNFYIPYMIGYSTLILDLHIILIIMFIRKLVTHFVPRCGLIT